MKGYWIARVDVTDPERYKAYVAANAAPFAEYGARFLVRGGAFENPEGASRARNVVLEFDSYDTALACYRSSAYQQAVALRKPASEADLVIVEGHDDGTGSDTAAGGYWIGGIDVRDPEGYKTYLAADAEPFAAAGARFIVRGGRSENPEGGARARIVVIAFESYAAALGCYRSPGYQAARVLREAAADSDIIIIEGYRP